LLTVHPFSGEATPVRFRSVIKVGDVVIGKEPED
jgi:hypothetical protein